MKCIPRPTIDDSSTGVCALPQDGSDLLGRLLGDIPLDGFLASHCLRAPHQRVGTGTAFIPLASQELIDAHLREACGDFVFAHEGSSVDGMDPDAYREALRDPSCRLSDVAEDPAAIRSLLADGWSMGDHPGGGCAAATSAIGSGPAEHPR